MNMAPNDNEMGRMSASIESLQKTVVSLESKVDTLTVNINEIKMLEAKRQGAESVAKWLIGIIGGVAGAVLSRIVHGM